MKKKINQNVNKLSICLQIKTNKNSNKLIMSATIEAIQKCLIYISVLSHCYCSFRYIPFAYITIIIICTQWTIEKCIQQIVQRKRKYTTYTINKFSKMSEKFIQKHCDYGDDYYYHNYRDGLDKMLTKNFRRHITTLHNSLLSCYCFVKWTRWKRRAEREREEGR